MNGNAELFDMCGSNVPVDSKSYDFNPEALCLSSFDFMTFRIFKLQF